MNQKKYDVFTSITKKQTYISLLLILSVGIIVRLYFLPSSLPLTLDSFVYFVYSLALVEQGPFPTDYLRVNFGWSTFLSTFFIFFRDSEMLELMNVQRVVSILISVGTIIPIYYLAKIFFRKETSILAAAVFIFEPHIIMNSINGGTIPLFILLVTLVIFFSFYQKRYHFVFAFICTALAAFVRYEGLLLLLPLIVAIFLEKNYFRKKILNFGISFTVFFLVMIPISLIGYNAGEVICNSCLPDFLNEIPIIAHIFSGGDFVTQIAYSNELGPNEKFAKMEQNEGLTVFLFDSIIGYIKFFIFVSIPILILGLLFSMIFISKKITRNRIVVVIFSIILSISGLYAFGRGIEETRYIFPLIPIMILFSLTSFERLLTKKYVKKIGVCLIIATLCVSITFIGFQKSDYQQEEEIYKSALFIVDNAKGVNLEPGGRFMKIAEMENNWKQLPLTDDNGKIFVETKRLSINNYHTVEEYLQDSQKFGLTHIVVYNENDKKFLTEVFYNEKEYPYLTKVYDSSILGHKKYIKIFEVDFEQFGHSILE